MSATSAGVRLAGSCPHPRGVAISPGEHRLAAPLHCGAPLGGRRRRQSLAFLARLGQEALALAGCRSLCRDRLGSRRREQRCALALDLVEIDEQE